MQSGKTDYTPFLIAGGVFLAWNQLFGQTKEEKEEGKATTTVEKEKLPDDPFSAGFIPPKKKEGYIISVLQDAELKKIAKKIWDGFGYLFDDESQIMNAIKRARTKTDLWHIRGYYSKKYKRDLWTDIDKNFSKKEKGKVSLFVVKLPDYIKA